MIIDTDCVDRILPQYDTESKCCIIEGHITQVLTTVEYVIVLRCHPTVLSKRLQDKTWAEKKIRENIASEILGVILTEAIELHGIGKVIELDSSTKSIPELVEIIIGLLQSAFENIAEYQPGSVDWLPVILEKEYTWMVNEDGP